MTTPRTASRPLLGLAVAALLAGVLGGCGSDDDSGSTTATDTPASGTPSEIDSGASATSAPVPSSEPPTAPPTSSAPAVPAGTRACAEVWVDEGRIPGGYKGCLDDAGAFVKADRLGCSSGQALIRFDDRFYGVAGGTVHEAAESPLLDDPDYTETVEGCRA